MVSGTCVPCPGSRCNKLPRQAEREAARMLKERLVRVRLRHVSSLKFSTVSALYSHYRMR